ncbi:DUF982 domain-containing protein [Pararhizobium sp. LjRoot255]|uniref:DUF982 domain-containing protein n=1 Tax=Pararhizobium sp. LjRoot255 TaxID=3342298 RepID=UPI003ED023A1
MAYHDVLWTLPLKITMDSGLERTFDSVCEASVFLENEWPLRRGEFHDGAVSACRRVLNRMTPATAAREAFIAACLEAGMPAIRAAPLPYARSNPLGTPVASPSDRLG